MTNHNHVEPTIITREYNAPMALVFAAWTEVDRLQKWMVPMPGVTCEYVYASIEVGGTSLHKMTFPNGNSMFLLTEYEEISPEHRLVFLQWPSNEAGEKLGNPQMPDWPKDMRTTIKLSESNGVTQLQLIWEPVNPTAAEAAAFEASRAQHANGWGSGLQQLETYLSSL
ncbi:SRPBCC domain-containing protein [Reinekea sp. G2M2-21]|uniref:SRPBCC family protein n=1 Tax=Reinekea sp. G2M2-21 TaxID=2788942 RepID=UPI0018AB79A6|nr:SRPBCC domain-containing protein [Reinekea sp. G2M2-21]